MAVIDSGVYVGGSRVGGRLEPLDAVREARAQGGIAWISLSRPRPQDLQSLATLLKLHPLAVRDSLKGHQRASSSATTTYCSSSCSRRATSTPRETVECCEVISSSGPTTSSRCGSEEPRPRRGRPHEARGHPEILAQGPLGGAVGDVRDVAPVLARGRRRRERHRRDRGRDLLRRRRRLAAHLRLQREVIDLQHATAPLRRDVRARAGRSSRSRRARPRHPPSARSRIMRGGWPTGWTPSARRSERARRSTRRSWSRRTTRPCAA